MYRTMFSHRDIKTRDIEVIGKTIYFSKTYFETIKRETVYRTYITLI